MNSAINEAKKAELRGSVPVGAVVVHNNKIIASAGNEVIKDFDPTAHAEILAIRKACSFLESHIINKCDIYVTLEPCIMCAQAISFAKVSRLCFGAYDIKYGAVEQRPHILYNNHHKIDIVGGILEEQCAQILQDFFQKRRH